MEEMVRALLTLARLDDDTCAGGRHLVDLDDVVLAEVKRARRPDGPEIDATGVVQDRSGAKRSCTARSCATC